jgi:glycine/D-amino acid oxidase-like deaminating enzyme
MQIVVIGAGAFGGWTALELLRRGQQVTLIDSWGPGNVRASSGGETRVIRAGYGSRTIYTRMAAQALTRWREHDARYGRRLYQQTGALWMLGRNDSFGRATFDALRAQGIAIDDVPLPGARRRYPQIDFRGVKAVLFEPEAGFLLARRACEHIVELLVAEGGEYRQAAAASPVRLAGTRIKRLKLSRGRPIAGDAFVFACGPWLGNLFPDAIGRRVTPTRQDVFYFGTPAGDTRFSDAELPVWVDLSTPAMYGIPGNANRGFKIADDTSGAVFDPTGGDRHVTPGTARRFATYLKRRFPALAGAPLVGSEVCQYEASPDSHFIVDRHPAASNVWIVGGGSGHGFKMGPIVGEMVAELVLGKAGSDPAFGLARLATGRPRISADKWK